MRQEAIRQDDGLHFLAQLQVGGGEARMTAAVLVVTAHPDDEVIGTGGQLPRLQAPHFIHITDGAPRNMHDAAAAGFTTPEDYAAARRREFTAALEAGDIVPAQTSGYGVPDQEASRHLAEIARRLATDIGIRQPDAVITHPYEGGHPDHDATAFAVHAACRLLERQAAAAPAIVEMACYHHRAGRIAPFEFLPHGDDRSTTMVLSEAARRRKRRMIACFTTQQATLNQFPVELERFRPAPHYDFTEPPHDGTLFYEFFDWGMTGPRWRALARAALDELQMTGPL